MLGFSPPQTIIYYWTSVLAAEYRKFFSFDYLQGKICLWAWNGSVTLKLLHYQGEEHDKEIPWKALHKIAGLLNSFERPPYRRITGRVKWIMRKYLLHLLIVIPQGSVIDTVNSTLACLEKGQILIAVLTYLTPHGFPLKEGPTQYNAKIWA